MEDAQTLFEENPGLGYRRLGSIAKALSNDLLEKRNTDRARIEDEFSAAGESVAVYALKSGSDPLATTRELEKVGLIGIEDPRFAAAFDVMHEGRQEDYVKSTLTPDTMAKTILGYSDQLKDQGSKSAYIGMKVLGNSLKEHGGLNPMKVVESVERYAMSGLASRELQSEILKTSARYTLAYQIEARAKEKTRGDITTDQR